MIFYEKNNRYPLISIITISRNNAVGIEKTIQSVITQTYDNIEYIIIDGNSTDDTVSVIKKYEKYITFWVSESDTGIYNAMNKGIRQSKGEYVMFINSGDELFEPQSVSKILSQSDFFDIVYSNLKMINGNKTFIKDSPEKLTFQYFYLNAIPHPATLIKRKLFNSIGYYDETLKIVSDWKWFLIAICKMNVSYKKTDILAANFYEDGISSNKRQKTKLNEERRSVLQNEFPLYIDDYKRLNKYDIILYKLDLPARLLNWFKRKSFKI